MGTSRELSTDIQKGIIRSYFGILSNMGNSVKHYQKLQNSVQTFDSFMGNFSFLPFSPYMASMCLE